MSSEGTNVRCTRTLGHGEDGVERVLPTGAPTAFRIWKAGDNPTDFGVHRFTDRSARLLMTEQAVRGNLYSIDVDHLSVSPSQAPPEARKAVGWHRLELRDSSEGPELWATDVEWTDAVREGLERQPPEWRYFSPAYEIDKASGEIVSYTNTALTNTPATWSVTALAVRSGSSRIEPPESMSSAIPIAATRAYGAQRAARLPPGEHADLRRRMSGEPAQRTIGWDPDHPHDLVFPQIDKEEARRILAARAAEGRDGPPRNPNRGQRS